MLAAEYNKVEMLNKLIFYGARLNLQDDFGISFSVYSRSIYVILYCVVLGDTAVMIAAREKNKEAVRALIDAGAQLDVLNYENMAAADITSDLEIDSNIREERPSTHEVGEGKALKA
jgi:ankyrin repeat protein